MGILRESIIYILGEDRSNISTIMKMIGLDGGEGSGNFGHKGRPGQVGGSGAGGGSGESSEYKKKTEELREKVSSFSPNRKAYFLFHQGIMGEEEAWEASENGTIDEHINQYFDALEANGDPTPTKPLRGQVSLYQEVEKEKKHGGDYQQARKDYIKDWTGCDDAEAEKIYGQFQTWFGGGWTHADTETLDSYIDKDGAYDGEIYRGMKFTEEEYQQFMNGMKPGAKFGMKGYNSSWTNSDEMAIAFSHGGDRSVLLKCVKNKTSAPVSHLSTHGEDEVLAHSKAQWTVLGVIEGDRRTVITVMEAEDRMSDSEAEGRRAKEFGGVVHDSVGGLEERMNQQSKYFHVVRKMAKDGGSGSGNFGHAGRPGMRGGSAKRGGGGVSKQRAKEIRQDRLNFKRLSRSDKIETLKKVGQFPESSNFDEETAQIYADRHNMSVDKWLNWRAARYYTMRKYQPEIEYKSPLKKTEKQGHYLHSANDRLNYIKSHTGVSDGVAKKMRDGLSSHFGSATAPCEWVDKFIDSDSRYEGAIYRWKNYKGDKAKQVIAGLVPGAKVQNKHETNWSFSSDPWETRTFGNYDSYYRDEGEISVRYTCDRNITASPVQCLSSFDDDEREVIPHSKTTWTITSVEKVQMPRGGVMYDVHMVEDDWHEERGIPVWEPSEKERAKEGQEEKKKHTTEEVNNMIEQVKNGDYEGDVTDFIDDLPEGYAFNDKINGFKLEKNADGDWEYFDEDGYFITTVSPKSVEYYFKSDKCDFEGEPLETGTSSSSGSSASFNEKEKEFDSLKNGISDELTQFFIDAPTGTVFETEEHFGKPIAFEKQDDGMWIDKNGNYSKRIQSSSIWTMTGESSKLISYPSGSENGGIENSSESIWTTPSGTEIKLEKPTSYGQVESALFDLSNEQDYEGTQKYLDVMPDGTKMYDEDGDKMWEKKDGEWVETWDEISITSEDLAESIIDKQSFSCSKLPLETPKNAEEANKMLTDLKNNKPIMLGDFIQSCPEDTFLCSYVDGGKVFKKFGTTWMSVDVKDGENPTPAYFYEHKDDVKFVNGMKIFNIMKNETAWIPQWGSQEKNPFFY